MGYCWRVLQMQIWSFKFNVVVLMFLAVRGAAADQVMKPGCQESCGNISIPYPFGTSPECYIAEHFLITCNTTTNDTAPQAFLTTSNIPVLEISVEGQLRISGLVGYDCYNSTGSLTSYFDSWLNLGKFTISTTQNKFTAVGCDTYAEVYGSRGRNYTTGCLSRCNSIDDVINGSCSGIGCCQASIPRGVRAYNIGLGNYSGHVQVHDFNPCSYAFVAEDGAFNFSSSDLFDMRGKMEFPLVLDWAVGNQTCDEAKKDAPNYACKENTECHDSTSGPGYGCTCSDGYQGNPYLGCHDIDECSTLNPCNGICQNLPGSFNCSCLKGYEGDGKKNGTGCTLIVTQSHKLPLIIILGTTSIILLVILLVGSWIYLGLRERQLIKRKEKFFEQNGGVLLQQLVSEYEGCAEVTQIFTAKDLEKATNNFHESRILGQGGQGTVYKGIFPDNRVVAIKKSKIMDQSQVEQFINEVHILSQINHRNVVKLLGCCLETQVPLLVYEFVTNGTLSSHIHDQNSGSSLPWETCLRIASETAGALSYLHSSASTPIVHRDIKSTNVLLDDNFTAKISDFGASRFVPLDQTQVATLVQGTFGYLDPEYLHSGQLTDKSDVYSFGILLLELITGKNVISPDRPEKERNLAALFHYAMEENRLLEVLDGRILNEENAQYLMEVAMLAKRCLKVQSQERPTMKEVAMELDRVVRPKAKQKSVEGDWSLKENEPLLNESLKTPYDRDCSSSIGYDSLTREVQLRIIESGR